jgi:hypothetical protein
MNDVPKTLIHAILNGLEESGSDSYNGVTAAYVEKHVMDYVSRAFTGATLESWTKDQIWTKIFKGSAFEDRGR